MPYNDFKKLFHDIKAIKREVILMDKKDLPKFKKEWYTQPFSEFRLDWCWKYFWGEVSYQELKKIMQMKG